MELTASRREVHVYLMKPLPMFATLALASGGSALSR